MVILKNCLCCFYNEGDLNHLPTVKLAHYCLLTRPGDGFLCIRNSSVGWWGKALLTEDEHAVLSSLRAELCPALHSGLSTHVASEDWAPLTCFHKVERIYHREHSEPKNLTQ